MQPHGRTTSGEPLDGTRARALRISPHAVLTLALGLGFAGRLTYFLLWVSARIYGKVILQFGIWGGPRPESARRDASRTPSASFPVHQSLLAEEGTTH